ncbi:unnamed protein product [Urochloa decumbens]|uniref:[RNA-polymerase]-subunit kinase n=1 Tax=Urochloa decumbens TaxID=240449 RepID=A0ABC9EL45_9POAL
MEAALPVTARKRPAPEEARRADATKKKRARYDYEFDDINEYEMLEEIGKGAFGVVAKARDRRTGETVAVKRIRGGLEADGDNDGAPVASLLPAVVREAGCLAACRGHPGIVQIKTVAAGGDDLYIVMELVPDAATLRSELATRGRPFSEDETRDVMRQLLGAVDKLRATGTIHRDINPDNILVTADGELKLCGFGCVTPARRVGCPEKPVGTLQYCAPEQMFGLRRYGPKVDVWALGCVMAELLSGEPLFTGTTEDDMFTEVVDLRDDFITMGVEAFDGTALDHLSMAGREVLASLLAFDLEDRLTAADALKHRWFTEEEEAEDVLEHPFFAEEEEDPHAAMELKFPGFESPFAAPAA